jgi:hypothetical protein
VLYPIELRAHSELRAVGGLYYVFFDSANLRDL